MTTAVAHPNLALLKYWGKRDEALRLPATPSLGLTLDAFRTTTTVTPIDQGQDEVLLGGLPAPAEFAGRVTRWLDRLAPRRPHLRVSTDNDFPTKAGLASSSSGFAALSVAAARVLGLDPSPQARAIDARLGSGSATRSVAAGVVHWPLGDREDGLDSYGETVLEPHDWPLAVVILVLQSGPKALSSSEAMERCRRTSPLHAGWVEAAPAMVEAALEAVQRRDLPALGELTERSTYTMHASMWAASPPVRYWLPITLEVLSQVEALRAQGIGAWATSDAGPHVKVLCAPADAQRVADALRPWALATHLSGLGHGARVIA